MKTTTTTTKESLLYTDQEKKILTTLRWLLFEYQIKIHSAQFFRDHNKKLNNTSNNTQKRRKAMSQLHRLVRSRCALTVQAASKNNSGDGALSAILQLDTETESSIAAGAGPRLIECDLSPAQLFTLLASLEEAHAKLSSKHGEESS